MKQESKLSLLKCNPPEILFRGRKLEDNKWIYGYYVKNGDNHFIFTGETGKFPVSPVHHLMQEDFIRREIDINTLGQFINFTDKNKIKVFCGDVVKYKTIFDSGKGVVKYDDYLNEFVVATEDGYFICRATEIEEVIGNIYG